MNPDDVAALIVDTSREPCAATSARAETHGILKRITADLAPRFGLRAASEYPVTKPDGGSGYVDVVWLSGSEPIAAFEVDSSRRRKSLRKLLAMPVVNRFWIYYGQKDPTTFVESIDLQGCIKVVRTGPGGPQALAVGAETVSDTKASADRRALRSADEHIRQAIQFCWQALPEEERSLRRVELELSRLLQVALRGAGVELRGLRRPAPTKTRSNTQRSTSAQIRTVFPRAYERWTEEEDRLLRQRLVAGATVQSLSEQHQRRPSAIRSRLRKLGLI